MKTTEDCINLLIQKYPNTSAADWKRRSKTKVYGGFQRLFENTKTGQWSSVTEIDDVLTEQVFTRPKQPQPQVFNLKKNKSLKSKYIYSILSTYEDGTDEEDVEAWDGMLAVSLREDFEKEGHSSDYVDEDIVNALMKIGLDAEDETSFSIPKRQLNQTKEALNALPPSLITYSQEFTNFLKTCDSTYGWKPE